MEKLTLEDFETLSVIDLEDFMELSRLGGDYNKTELAFYSHSEYKKTKNIREC